MHRNKRTLYVFVIAGCVSFNLALKSSQRHPNYFRSNSSRNKRNLTEVSNLNHSVQPAVCS